MKERPKSPRARLFVALEPPDAARDALFSWQHRFTARVVTLYRSHLEPAGARHDALARFTLAAGPLSEPS